MRTKDELNAYEVEPDRFWQALLVLGGDGYDGMDIAGKYGWRAIGDWGKPGYNLGSWPLIIIYFRERQGRFEVAEYVEGDVAVWSCPTEELRQAVTDELAFFHWKHRGVECVQGYESVDQLPGDLRGPYRSQ